MIRRRRTNGDENDYLDPKAKNFYRHPAGVRKAVKTRANRRERRQGRQAAQADA